MISNDVWIQSVINLICSSHCNSSVAYEPILTAQLPWMCSSKLQYKKRRQNTLYTNDPLTPIYLPFWSSATGSHSSSLMITGLLLNCRFRLKPDTSLSVACNSYSRNKSTKKQTKYACCKKNSANNSVHLMTGEVSVLMYMDLFWKHKEIKKKFKWYQKPDSQVVKLLLKWTLSYIKLTAFIILWTKSLLQ